MSTQSLDARMEKACRELDIPGAVVVASNREGSLRYAKAFGQRSLKSPGKPDPLTLEACLWIASCTKLLTSIAALQCVEKGLLNLDNDVTAILVELKDRRILVGFHAENGEPILVENNKPITLRHLLTHSSGLGYAQFDSGLMKYRKWKGQRVRSADRQLPEQAHEFPLLFAPGESWEYGVGIDWAGVMVERVSNMSLENYFHENMWVRLDVKSFTFHPNKAPAVLEKMADLSLREGGIHPLFGVASSPNSKVVYTGDKLWSWEAVGCHGGGGGFCNMVDYQKVLHSICADDGKLLQTSSIDEMFTPQLSSVSQDSLMAKLAIPELNQVYGSLPPGTKADWGLGGLLNMEDLKGERRNGTLNWGGLPNLSWFCDRVGGMSGIYGSQINPPGDLKTNELCGLWIRELYTKAGKEKL